MKKIVVVLAVVALAAPVFAAGIEVATGIATPIGHVGATARGITAYSNITNDEGYYYGQSGLEVADDLYMTQGGELESFGFSYYQPAGGAVTAALINFYGMDAVTGEPTDLIASYLLTAADGLPATGGWIFNNIGVGPGTILPQDIWMSVQFDSPTAGQIMMNPPTVGASDDVFARNDAPWTYHWFGGPPNPIANFGLEVVLTPEPTSMILLGLAGLLIRRR
jgi:hypothetical protein